MRSLVLIVVAAALSAQAPAPAELATFDQALAAYDYERAGAEVDKLIHARVPADGVPRQDPLLNALLGRLYLNTHHVREAADYLDHAQLAALPAPMRAATALAHGRTLELRGDRAAALAAYREAASTSVSEDQRRRASIGIAKQMLPDNPAALRDQLLPLANGAANPERWEARYMLAVANSLAGDGASARQWADQAWVDAASAPVAALAPLKVAALRAALAASVNDVATERAMLTASNGLNIQAGSDLAAQMPVCGDSALSPTDFVTFAIVAGPYSTYDLTPVAASRPVAVAPFFDNLSGFSLIDTKAGTAPRGTVITVRCRTVVSPSYASRRDSGDPLLAWAIEKGIYPASALNNAEDRVLNSVSDWVDTLAARFGKDSPLLIMPRVQLMTLLAARAASGDPVQPGQLIDLRSVIASDLRRAGAPGWLASTLDMQTELQRLAAAAEEGVDPMSEARRLARKQLLELPFGLSRSFLAVMFSKASQRTLSAEAYQMILDLNAKVPTTLPLRERQAWQLNVAEALRNTGREREVPTLLASVGLPKDICAASDNEPKLLEQKFSYSDYPHQLLAGEQEGAVLYEFGLAPTGAVATPRIIYSLPTGLFDAPSAKGLATVRYSEPSRNRSHASCRGLYQPIIWRLDDGSEPSIPVMNPVPTDATT